MVGELWWHGGKVNKVHGVTASEADGSERDLEPSFVWTESRDLSTPIYLLDIGSHNRTSRSHLLRTAFHIKRHFSQRILLACSSLAANSQLSFGLGDSARYKYGYHVNWSR